MNKTKRLLLVSHCLLNPLARVQGPDQENRAGNALVDQVQRMGIGIIQLPCPELTRFGLKRWGHVYEQFDTIYYRKHCREIGLPLVEQVLEYTHHGYQVTGLVGIEGSPSCGVSRTCSNVRWGGELSVTPDLDQVIQSTKLIGGSGVFVEELKSLFAENSLDLPFLGLDLNNPEVALRKLASLV